MKYYIYFNYFGKLYTNKTPYNKNELNAVLELVEYLTDKVIIKTNNEIKKEHKKK